MTIENLGNITEKKMSQSIEHLINDFSTIRTGRANPALIDKMLVDYYGTQTPLNQIATISVPDPKLLVVHPFDQNSIPEIEKSINNSDLGLNANNDGDLIRIPIPSLSEERRKELGKVASKNAEETKVSIRNHRRSALTEIEKNDKDFSADDIKRYEDNIQSLTNKFIDKVEEILKQKQDELLEV